MKYWINPSKKDFDFVKIRNDLNSKVPEEKYK